MSQHVWMDVVHPGLLGQSSDDLPDGDSLQWPTRIAQQKSPVVTSVLESGQFGVEILDILPDGLACGYTYRHEPFTIPLSMDKNDSECLLVFMETDGSHFGGSQSGSVHELEHGSIPQPESTGIRGGRFKKQPHLFG